MRATAGVSIRFAGPPLSPNYLYIIHSCKLLWDFWKTLEWIKPYFSAVLFKRPHVKSINIQRDAWGWKAGEKKRNPLLRVCSAPSFMQFYLKMKLLSVSFLHGAFPFPDVIWTFYYLCHYRTKGWKCDFFFFKLKSFPPPYRNGKRISNYGLTRYTPERESPEYSRSISYLSMKLHVYAVAL